MTTGSDIKLITQFHSKFKQMEKIVARHWGVLHKGHKLGGSSEKSFKDSKSRIYPIHSFFSCSADHVIYCHSCPCNLLYVDQAVQAGQTRFGEHRRLHEESNMDHSDLDASSPNIVAPQRVFMFGSTSRSPSVTLW